MARSDLRSTPLLGKSSNTAAQHRPFVRAKGLEYFEPRLVHRIEGQRELEARFGRGVQLSSRSQRFLALELSAVTLKTNRLCVRPRCCETSPHLVQARTASSTEGLRTFAFEFSALEHNPLIVSGLRISNGFVQHAK